MKSKVTWRPPKLFRPDLLHAVQPLDSSPLPVWTVACKCLVLAMQEITIGGNYEISQFAPPVRGAHSAVEPHGHSRCRLGTAGITTAGPDSSRANRSSRGATDPDFYRQVASIEGQLCVKK